MEVRTCSTCRHFAALGQQCRKDPPTALPVPIQEGMRVLAIWPPVTKADWCGQHAEAPPVLE